MVKVMFVCLGNICRSPMAEFVFKDLVSKNGLTDMFLISSSATSSEEVGNDIHYGTKQKLREQGIPFTRRAARKFTTQDYNEYDYILVMENANIRGLLRIIGEDGEQKITRLKDYADGGDIADPWYTGNFDDTYRDVLSGCTAFFKSAELKPGVAEFLKYLKDRAVI